MRHHSYGFSKSKSKSKKVKLLSMILPLIVMGFGGFWYITSADPKSVLMSFFSETQPKQTTSVDLQPTDFPKDTQQQNSLKPDSLSENLSTQDESYVLLDPITHQVLKSHNADVRRAAASTQKLLTGLVAMKSLKENDVIKVGPEVIIEGSQLGLRPGDEISIHDLLIALYVHSSNDAAAALAVKTSGSIPAFAQEMNDYAASLGCENSHFTNPHGLPDPNQYTSAGDLSKIASEFLKDKELMQFVKMTKAHVQWKDEQGGLREADLQNTNGILEIYPGNQGLKTGTTTKAGQCLVSYVTRTDGDLLLVLLGSKQRYRDTIQLLDEAWAEERMSAALKGLANDPGSLILSPGIF